MQKNLDRFKFRAWNLEKKTMFEIISIRVNYSGFQGYVYDYHDGRDRSSYNTISPSDCILMQSTGIKDRKGKLIYEGDILHSINNNQSGSIVYNDGTFF